MDKDKKNRNYIKNYININYKSIISNPIINKHSRILVILFKFKLDFFYFSFYIKIKDKFKKLRYRLGNHSSQ